MSSERGRVVLSRLYTGIDISADDAEKIARGASMIGLSDTSSSFDDAQIVRLTNSGILIALAKYGDDGIFKVLKRFDRDYRW